jgi:putative transposase
VLNPVRAKAVKDAGEWKWSSYRGTAGKDKPHPCLTKDWISGQFGTKRRQSEKKYREFVMVGIGEGKIWKDVKGQSILGKDEFTERYFNHERSKGDTEEPEIYWKTRTCGTTERGKRKKRDKQKGKRGCREIWIQPERGC